MSNPRDRYTFANQSSIPPPLYKPIHTLLSNWDKTADATHAYLNAFSETATLDLPPNKSTGLEAIRALRNGLIHPTNGPVIGVQHTFERVYVLFGDDKGDNMNVAMTGRVEYTVRGGKKVEQEFATTFDLVPVDEKVEVQVEKTGEGEDKREWKIEYAKIYSDNAPLMGRWGRCRLWRREAVRSRETGSTEGGEGESANC